MDTTPRVLAGLLSLALMLQCQNVIGQACSPESLTAKYWQYRKNFTQHFVMNDRSPDGCIGNGITRSEGAYASLSCDTDLLHGYGTPATSITMGTDGGGGMEDRNSQPPNPVFHDQLCANAGPDPGVSFYENPEGIVKHNFLEYGSETPHQLGWYLTVLATEYVLWAEWTSRRATTHTGRPLSCTASLSPFGHHSQLPCKRSV